MALNSKTLLSILIVDDDSGIIELFRESLTELHFTVFSAGNAKEALHFLAKTKVDCIITDIAMPGMSGVEFISDLKLHGDTTPFFFITGYHDYPLEELNRFKPRAIIFKPFDFEEASLLVKSHLTKIG